ncbi:hypothetical protein DMA15_19985 [Streptomyces sp. WAC 01529]|uniref:restriction endonuclease subunit S n=1 Tax=Streptomyces sp. WAC 01529 TaxID=2203205 RepID=UPI000F6C416F|nr:restriction endonuclease subunit S [Streptomyces sp. WAC 01529]AZM54560.1 hypothetical protein DMA15_19985 [Streptomyces sp. WAC 01529]
MTTETSLGHLPANWSSERAKWLLGRQLRQPRPDDGVVTAFRDGQVTLRANRRVDGFTEAVQEIGYQGIRRGDLVVHSMDGFAGAIGISDADGKCSPVVHAYQAKGDADLRYIAYVLRSMASSGYVESLAKGIRERSTSFDSATLANLVLPHPPLIEQQRIADFLDAETNRIHRLAGLRTSQLEKISTRVQSHLSQVAKSLEIKHGTVRVRHVLQKIEQGWSPQCEDRPTDEGEWGVVKAGCVNGGTFDASQHKALPPETQPELRYSLRSGDLLMSRASGSVDLIGSIAVLPEDLPPQLLLCDKVYRLRMDRTRMTPEFVAFMLGTHQVRELIKLGISGADGMANNLPTATVTKLPLPDAPLTDQARVVNDLNDRRRSGNAAKQALVDQLALLKEHRLALITAAVTGQFDVTTASGRSLPGSAV